MPETWFKILKLKRGVPEDGPASKDENYSSGKGKDKKIESESKLTKEQWLHMVASPRIGNFRRSLSCPTCGRQIWPYEGRERTEQS